MPGTAHLVAIRCLRRILRLFRGGFSELAGKHFEYALAFIALLKMLSFLASDFPAVFSCEIEETKRLEMLVAFCHEYFLNYGTHIGG